MGDNSKVGEFQSEPIAVVGMSCRLPGGADNTEEYWRLLLDFGTVQVKHASPVEAILGRNTQCDRKPQRRSQHAVN